MFNDPSAQEKEELRKVAIETQADSTNKFFRGDLGATPASSSAAIAKEDGEGIADDVAFFRRGAKPTSATRRRSNTASGAKSCPSSGAASRRPTRSCPRS